MPLANRSLSHFSCIQAIRKLQQFGHLPSDPALFESYAKPDNFTDVRITAITALVNYTKGEVRSEKGVDVGVSLLSSMFSSMCFQ